MSAWLLELSFGPVQGFIAAARRSGDLWAGSFILSELVRAAASELLSQKVQLIYPVARRVEEEKLSESSNLSNILLACIDAPDDKEVRALAEAVKHAARKRLLDFANDARHDWEVGGVDLRDHFWRSQVDDAIEAYAAWAQIPAAGEASKSAYRVAYEHLKQTLAARKNTRDFLPMFPEVDAGKGAGVPKCSFDGLRESVLPAGRREFPPRFGLSRGEQLDALGCIKRIVGRAERFTALTRFAVDAWLQQLDEAGRCALAAVHEPLVKEAIGLATRAKGNGGIYASFPYDGGLLLPERFEIASKESHGNADAEEALLALGKVLKPLWQKYGRPCPYSVMVVADGDRMGRFVDKAQSAEEHTRISDAVASFADRVPGVARSFRGQCVFAGGEDLTVFFPLATVVEAAQALQKVFEEAMAEVVRDLVGDDQAARPTLRVGAAICHVLEPLGVIRQRAAAAEKFAKGDAGLADQGNALGLKLHIRAGHEIGVRLRFGEGESGGLGSLLRWQEAYAKNQLPGRLAYDTHAIAMRCRAMGAAPAVAEGEFRRLVERARQSGGSEKIGEPLPQQLFARRTALAAEDDGDPAGLMRLADELILARWLSAASEAQISALQGGQ